MNRKLSKNIIEETKDFVAFDTGKDHDFITIITNKTHHDLLFCPYGVWKEFVVPANECVGLLNDDDGRDTRYALIVGDYDYSAE